MKLKSFQASAVHGYLTFGLKFDERLAFLIGPNGSGKSTALALIEAILTPSLRDLTLIEFSKAKIEFEESGVIRCIEVHKNEDNLEICANWLEEPARLKRLDRKRRELLANDPAASDDYFEKLALEYSSDQVLRAIAECAAPVFLGIERQHKSETKDVALFSPSRTIRYPMDARTSRRLLRGNLAAGLVDTQILVQEGYRTARRQMDAAQERLRTDVLLSAFKYSDIGKDSDGKPIYDDVTRADFKELQQSKDDIGNALAELGVPKKSVDERVNAFFHKLSLLNKQMDQLESDETGHTIIEYLTNRGHVDRLKDLISLIQDFNKKTGKVFGRLDQFKSYMNWFYRDSGKTVDVDQVGRLVITRQDGSHVPLDALSSGERQLLIIFAHIFFNSYAARSRVFVVDEPELSLHLRWQENLVDRIRSASPDAQLIFATHSPDIVGEFKNNCVQVI